MRDGPPTGEGPYVRLGLMLTTVGGLGLTLAGLFGLGIERTAVAGLSAFAGILILELTGRLWGRR